MTGDRITAAAEILRDARLSRTVIDGIPAEVRPRNIDEAFAVRDRLAELLGFDIGGWFCGATNPAIQTMLGIDRPFCGRLFAHDIFHGPTVLTAADYPPIVLEVEFAYRFGRDLPPRDAPYGTEDVAAAVDTVHPVIEVVAGHLKDWPNQEIWSVIADNGTDGALICGEGRSDWRDLDLDGADVVLEVNGTAVRTGAGRNIPGGPLAGLVWLANDRSRAGDGLKAGHVHNTGTVTEVMPFAAGDTATARFDGFGTAHLKLR